MTFDLLGQNATCITDPSNPICNMVASNPDMNASIGDIIVHSPAEYEAVVKSMNDGFQFAAQKFGLWIDLLFIGVVVFVLMRAIKGVNHKTKWFSDNGMLRLTQIEGIALTYVCTMALYLFALQWIPYFS